MGLRGGEGGKGEGCWNVRHVHTFSQALTFHRPYIMQKAIRFQLEFFITHADLGNK